MGCELGDVCDAQTVLDRGGVSKFPRFLQSAEDTTTLRTCKVHKSRTRPRVFLTAHELLAVIFVAHAVEFYKRRVSSEIHLVFTAQVETC